MKTIKKSKKAVSVMVEYVLLISFMIVLGIVTYSVLRTYIPQEELACPDEVSIFIDDYSYNCATKILVINLTNKGNFNLGGYFIYATSSPEANLATVDLSKNNTDSSAKNILPAIKFTGTDNSLEPDEKEMEEYNLTGINQIYSIEILPIRWQEQKNKKVFVSCQKAKVRKTIECA